MKCVNEACSQLRELKGPINGPICTLRITALFFVNSFHPFRQTCKALMEGKNPLRVKCLASTSPCIRMYPCVGMMKNDEQTTISLDHSITFHSARPQPKS